MASEGVRYREHAPHPLLRGAVKSYSSYEERHTASTEEHHLLPDANIDLVFNCGDARIEGGDGRLRPLPPVFVIGVRDRSARMVSRGLSRVLGVRFHPWHAASFLEREADVRGYCTIVGPGLEALSGQVAPLLAEGACGAALRLVEAWLLARRRVTRRAAAPVAAAGLALHASDGGARVGALAERLGVSVRQLERQFKRAAGLSPKALARLIRFSRATERLELDPGASLTALAFELGYADQAHFIREFRAFAGMSPGRYAGEVRRLWPPGEAARGAAPGGDARGAAPGGDARA
ncbi:helix-turn-helix domain-containing protein [Sorangium sp. So ce1151]|uniref:AraC family transcriptional regulator n=1 Tax=Sorangium sp. So ce1151 TaxID=3133332 RepID=UPI003F63F2D1